MGALAIDLEKLERLVPGGDSTKARRILADSSELVERATTELRTVSYPYVEVDGKPYERIEQQFSFEEVKFSE